MKKLIALLMLLCLCLSLFACGNNNDTTDEVPEEPEENVSKTPYEDKLKEYSTQNSIYKHEYVIYTWTKNNIEKFKNPASVEFTGNAYYHTVDTTSESEVDFYLVEYRADNGFGGKTVSYMKLTAYSIVAVDWTPPLPVHYNYEQVWKCFMLGAAEDALNEYISLNY